MTVFHVSASTWWIHSFNSVTELQLCARYCIICRCFYRQTHNCIYHFYCILNCQPQICTKVFLSLAWASLLTQSLYNPPAMWETWVWSLGWENPPEEGMATHSSILAWRLPMDRRAWHDTIHRVTKSWTWLSH